MLKKFSKSRVSSLRTHYLLSRTDVQTFEWQAEQSFLIVSRGEVFSILVNLSGIPANAQERYVSMQALRHSPYKEFSIYTAWLDKNRCLVWGWDANWERETRKTLPSELQRAEIIPETVLHPQGDQGAILRACGRGYELQFWNDACLQSSRWFPQKPTDTEMLSALRTERLEVLSDSETAVTWLPKPWPEAELDWRSLIRNERTVFTLLVCAVLFFLCFQLGLGGAYAAKSLWGEARIESLGEQLGDQLDQRLQAERQRDINVEWISVFEPYSHLDVVAEFTSALAGTDYDLLDWGYQDGTLRVVIFDEDIDTRDVVSRLAQRDLFSQLRIEPGPREGESILTMQLPRVSQDRQSVQ
jgi:hypothetical protein